MALGPEAGAKHVEQTLTLAACPHQRLGVIAALVLSMIFPLALRLGTSTPASLVACKYEPLQWDAPVRSPSSNNRM